jgi:hypothetical protein
MELILSLHGQEQDLTQHKYIMAHYARIDSGNIVVDIQCVNNWDITDANGIEIESKGVEILERVTGKTGWVKCSYNTIGNKHILGGTPFRYNYPSKGDRYDSIKDAFIPQKPVDFPSYVFDEVNLIWTNPVPYPTGTPEDKLYIWNEVERKWVLDPAL